MKIAHISIQYSGFVVIFIGQDDPLHQRIWTPGKGEYEKNLFCTYVYQGEFNEHRIDNNELVRSFKNEFFSNINLVLDYPTVELIPKLSTWLCFSSYKPLEGSFVRLEGSTIVPAGTGAYCVLGSFAGDGVTAKALNYLKPRDHDVEISGNAKVIMIKPGQFVNVPA